MGKGILQVQEIHQLLVNNEHGPAFMQLVLYMAVINLLCPSFDQNRDRWNSPWVSHIASD
jgi:hypothetical protein